MIQNFYQILNLPIDANQSEIDAAVQKLEHNHQHIPAQEWHYLKRIMLRPKARIEYNKALSTNDYKEKFFAKDAVPFEIDPTSPEHISGLESEQRKKELQELIKPVSFFIFIIISIALLYFM